ncbi:MAG TPA: DedA family protein [Ilumatobacter sp.]|nr:DedA family protein [Ilumatobacter sp.]
MNAALLANVITDASEWLEDFSSNWYFLVIIFVVAYLDSVVPIVPSETLVIVGGVAAGVGEQSLLLVILCGAVGAALGDNTAYLIGARMSGLIRRRAARSPKLERRLEWANEQIAFRGGPLLVTARFIPGGRTALTISCGITHQPRKWFVGWILVAVSIWATYAAVLGYVFGDTFDHTTALILAFITAIAINGLIELIRHLRARRR